MMHCQEEQPAPAMKMMPLVSFFVVDMVHNWAWQRVNSERVKVVGDRWSVLLYEDCECITDCVSSSFLVGCDEVMILTCERMNPYCLHSSNHRPLILPLPGPPLTITLIQKQGMNNIFRNKMSPVRNLVRSLKRIVKLKAKRPTLNG